MSHYADIIARLEKATGPDREMDGAIFMTTDPQAEEVAWYIDQGYGCKRTDAAIHCFTDTHTKNFWLPHYTASIDAALTLVPEGWSKAWSVHGGSECVAGADLSNGGDDFEDEISATHETTTAIALCIAALKARAASPPRQSTKVETSTTQDRERP